MSGVDEALVAKRAYEIWEAEGRPHGRHEEHWKKAMAEFSDAKARPAAARSRIALAKKKAAAAPVTVKSKKSK